MKRGYFEMNGKLHPVPPREHFEEMMRRRQPVVQAQQALSKARNETYDFRCAMTELERQKHIGIAIERYEEARRAFDKGTAWEDDEPLLV